ncbi:MAG TPA: bifunctional ADP-heptose synthase [Candidatus Limnocylindrales bacterium]|nr:bifunctional ADP-heptose synthase [Candidatus Limnocylindrales bacterium]
MNSDLHRWIPALAGLKVLVAGDLILDEYLIGSATRLSREAPIPVLEFEERRLIPGGAANPAANIAALGSTAIQLGVIGADDHATALRELLQARGIDVSALVVDAARPTTVKTRVMAHMGLRFPQQVARIDRVSRTPLPLAADQEIRRHLHHTVHQVQAVLFSDYRAGLLSLGLVEAGRQLARQSGALLAADAQGELHKYTGFDVIKCNADEARAFLRRSLVSDADFAEAARELAVTLHIQRAVVITRGADGATVALPNESEQHLPAPRTTEVFDTVGAGDTTIAVLTLALTAGATPVEAVMLANIASGLVVRRVGNYAPSAEELAEALNAAD